MILGKKFVDSRRVNMTFYIIDANWFTTSNRGERAL